MGTTARKTLADNLVRLMAENESFKTIKQLSAASGVSTGTIDRLRRAEVSAGVDHLDALAHAFKLAPADLLRPEAAASLPFRDLNTLEVQLVTYFRQMTLDQQRGVLIALHETLVPPVSRPHPHRKLLGGVSRLGDVAPKGRKRSGE